MTTTSLALRPSRAPSRWSPDWARLQHAFLRVLPRIERHATRLFRSIACPDRRADLIAETIALAWSRFLRCARRGRDRSCSPQHLARAAAQAVRRGQRLAGPESPTDALSPQAQRRQHFTVLPLDMLSDEPHAA